MSEQTTKHLELWADSFHEGDWAVRHVASILAGQGVRASVSLLKGFIPEYVFRGSGTDVRVTVFGSYRSWSPLPQAIADVLEWGKPDLILYDPTSKRIIFSVEETAAVPTGNQALQRCERMYGALRVSVPFWYLITEFGKHVDGGVRRDSIWPTVMALKLTRARRTPCVVLHYSDADNPEDYGVGKGLDALFRCLAGVVANAAKGLSPLNGMEEPLAAQFTDMLNFVKAQWSELVDFMPGSDSLDAPDLPRLYARTAMNHPPNADQWPANFLIWPRFPELPKAVRANQKGRALIKKDALCALLENDITEKRAYGLSNKTGSRPQPGDSIAAWITQQKKMFSKGVVLEPRAEYTVAASDFPESKSGLFHVTTAKNIVYLYDRWSDVQEAIETAFPRLAGKLAGMDRSRPALVYVSNSLKPGRIFGDPFTGQIAAFATIFGRFDPEPRYVIAYFPHQAYTQAVVGDEDRSNKGLTLMRELTDLLLFGGGVAVSLQTNEVL